MADIRYTFIATGYDAVAAGFKSIARAAREGKKDIDAFSTSAGSVGGAGRGAGRGATAASAGAASRRATDRTAALARLVERDQSRAAAREVRLAEHVADQKVRAETRAVRVMERERARVTRLQVAHANTTRRAQEAVEEGQRRRIAKVGMVAAGLAGGAAMSTLVGGLSVAAAATRDEFRLRGAATRLAINARGAGEAMQDPVALAGEFRSVAQATPGVRSLDIAEGIQSFVAKTGRLDIGRPMAQTFATAASATGADVQDIATAAADLFKKFKIEDITGMQEAFATLTFQGKKGAFELRDAAGEFAEMAAAAERFGIGTGPQAVKTLGGLAQIARESTGSAAEASTAVRALFSQLISDADKLRESGVRVFDDAGKSRDIKDVLTETMAIEGLDFEAKKKQLQQVFNERGIRAVSPLISTFELTATATAGTKAEKIAAGMAAVRAKLEDAMESSGTWADVVKDASMAQQQTSSKLTGAWELVAGTIGSEVVPKLAEMVGVLVESGALAASLDLLKETAGFAADALREMTQFLQDRGLIKQKQQTPYERLAKAQKEYDLLASKVASPQGITAKESTRMPQLRSAIDSAMAEVFSPVPEGQKTSVRKFDREAWIRRYAAYSATGLTPKSADQARGMLGRIEAEVSGKAPSSATNDWLMGLFGDETGYQKVLRQEAAGAVTAEKTGGVEPVKLDTDAANANLVALGGAAAATAKALATIKSPPGGALYDPARP